MGTKSHVFDINVVDNHTKRSHKTETVSLTDTPGLRPTLQDIIGDDDELALWLATRSIKPQEGMFSKSNPNYERLKTKIVNILWQGIKRHHEIKRKPRHIKSLKSPDELWKFHEDRMKNRPDGELTLDDFIQACVYGYMDGYCDRMIIERHPIGIDARGQPMLHYKSDKPPNQGMTIKVNKDNTIVAMNPSAVMLTNIGGGRLEFNKKKHSQLFLPPLHIYNTSEERNYYYKQIREKERARKSEKKKQVSGREVLENRVYIE
jgi:hypothetical protein